MLKLIPGLNFDRRTELYLQSCKCGPHFVKSLSPGRSARTTRRIPSRSAGAHSQRQLRGLELVGLGLARFGQQTGQRNT